jgi:hypothetical protein
MDILTQILTYFEEKIYRSNRRSCVLYFLKQTQTYEIRIPKDTNRKNRIQQYSRVFGFQSIFKSV